MLMLLSALGELFCLPLLMRSWALLCLDMENDDNAVSTGDPLARLLSEKPQGQFKMTVEMRYSKLRARNEDVRVHL